MKNMIDKPIPKGTSVLVTVLSNVNPDEFEVEIEPDEGYLYDLSYIVLDMSNAPELSAYLIGVTDEGEYPLINNPTESWSDDVTVGYRVAVLDRTDFEGVLFKKLVLKVTILSTTTKINRITLEFGGRMVTPWL